MLVCKFYNSPNGCNNQNCRFVHQPQPHHQQYHQPPQSQQQQHLQYQQSLQQPQPQLQPQPQTKPSWNHKPNKNKPNKPNVEDFGTQLNTLMGLVAFGDVIKRISIRVLVSCSFKYSNQFDVSFGNRAKCFVLYQQKERGKVIFQADYTEENFKKIKILIDNVSSNPRSYDVKNNNLQPFAMFYNGHILSSSQSFFFFFYPFIY